MEFGPILRAMSRNKVRYGLIVLEIALTLAIVTNCVSLIRERPEGARDAVGIRRREPRHASAASRSRRTFKEAGYLNNAVRADLDGAPGASRASRPSRTRASSRGRAAAARTRCASPARRSRWLQDAGLQRRRRARSRRSGRSSSRGGRSRARRRSRRPRGSPRSSRRPARRARTARRRSKITQDVVISRAFGAPRVRRRLAARQAARGQRRRPVPRRRRHRPLLQPVRLADPRVRHVLLGHRRRATSADRPTSCGRSRAALDRVAAAIEKRLLAVNGGRNVTVQIDPGRQGRLPVGSRSCVAARPDRRDRPAPLRHVARHHRPHVLLGRRAHAPDRDAARARRAEGGHPALLPARELDRDDARPLPRHPPRRRPQHRSSSSSLKVKRLDLSLLAGGVLLLWAAGLLATWFPPSRARGWRPRSPRGTFDEPFRPARRTPEGVPAS